MNDSELIQLSKDQDDYTYYLSNLSQLEQSWTDDQSCWPGTLMYILIFVLGLVGNGVVFVRLLFGGRHTFFLHKSTATLLASLVSADLVFLAVCVPHEVGLRMTLPWTGSRGVCKLFGFAEMLAAASSVINLAAISSERYVVIVHPMKARMLCTMQNTRKVIIVSWVVSAILSSPLIFITDLKTHLFYNNVTSIRTFICASNHFVSPSFEYVFGWYQLLILFVIPVAVLSFCYITVATVLWRSTKRFGTMTNQSYKFKSSNCNDNHLSDISEISTHRRSVHISLTSSNVTSSSNQDNVIKSRKKVVKMLVAIVVAFYLCWGPRMVLTLVVKYVPHIFHTDLFFDFQVYIRLLPYLHSCINPIIYVAMNKNFRTSVSNFCSKTSSICSVSRHFKGAQTRGSTASCCSCGRRDDEGSVKQESPGWWSENRPQSGLVGEGVSKKRAAGGKFFQMNEFRSSTNLSPTRKIPESPERGHYTAATCLSHS